MTFTLKIKTGNAAMQSARDIAEALICTAERLPITFDKGEKHPIRDINGNTVGEWKVG